MNPFDAPPSTPAVSLEPPVDPPAPRRGRTVAIVIGTAGVIGAGIVGVSQFAAADDPELTDAAGADRPELDLVAATDDEPADSGDDWGDDEPADADADREGEIRIQIGDGEPIVIDLGDGDLGAVLGELVDGEVGREFRECVGFPMLDLPAVGDDDVAPGELDLGRLLDQFFADGAMGELFDDEELQRWLDELGAMTDDTGWTPGEHEWGAWDLGDQVTVTGDDGLTVIDLGDGDASVTIERDGDTGEVTISTDGTATAQELDELFGDFDLGGLDLGGLDLPAPPDGSELDRIEECIADLEP